MAVFENGTQLKADNGALITIIKQLAEGGQGYVFLVDYRGEKKILKWYKPGFMTPARADLFHRNLENNVAKGAPGPAFVWPQALTEWRDGSFGYIMDVIDTENYKEFTKSLISQGGGGFTSFKTLVDACIKLVSAFRILHNEGYCYQDMNDGNFFINPKTGDVKICDNDNVAPNGTDTGILGTPRFMAPEIVASMRRPAEERKKPNTHTDEFSMAVILFMLLFKNHPLEGSRWVCPCLTPELEEKLYGTAPLFIYDPRDSGNRPVRQIHANVINRWGYMPQYLRETFEKAFSQEAIRDPNRRVKELDWLRVLTRFRSEIVRCPYCKNEIFISNATTTKCEKCGKPYPIINTLKLRNYAITAVNDSRVYRCQMGICNADEALMPVAAVVAKKEDPRILGLRNMSKLTAEGVTTRGEHRKVESGTVIPLKAGIQVKFADWGTIEIK